MNWLGVLSSYTRQHNKLAIWKSSNKYTHYIAYAVEFGWDNKDADINVLTSIEFLSRGSPLSKHLSNNGEGYRINAVKFVCSILPENLTSVNYSKGYLSLRAYQCHLHSHRGCFPSCFTECCRNC